MDGKEYIEKARRLTEAALEKAFGAPPVSPRLSEAMRYSLFAGGKRIRPALAYAACSAAGGAEERAVPVACALEMIHTYSLIHDDLPAMDDDELRRGRPTNHKVYGEGLAILAGDGLLTAAFTILADPSWDIPAGDRIDIVGIIAEGAGAEGMAAGQALDLYYENRPFDEEALQKIHKHKTGKLLRASVLAGGRAGGARGEAFENLDRYGNAIGLAFQIADDLLDLTSTPEELGKNTQKDANKKKATYPALLGEEESRRRASSLLDEALCALSFFGDRGEALAALARLIVERKS